MELYDLDDTICAVATPPGIGGISVIRLCGNSSVNIIKKLCSFLPDNLASHTAHFGLFKDIHKMAIDEVVVTYFKNGRSFTGNDVFEISCHGNQQICNSILNCFIQEGARLALKGEFTYRAFCNGRIDLVQAESVLSLIHSSSKKSSSLSLSNLRGDLSTQVDVLIEKLTSVLANFEANIDFSTQDIVVLPVKDFESQVDEIINSINLLIDSFKFGKKLYDGINISLIGLPNAGKSSLLNNLLGFDKAIVSNIPGTTRDIVEDSLHVNGVKFNFFDTAGIRASDDHIEKLGIIKSKETIEVSDYIFFVHDCNSELISDSDFNDLFSLLSGRDVVFINTKIDIDGSKPILSSNMLNPHINKVMPVSEFLSISNNTKDGLSSIFNLLDTFTSSNFIENSAVVIQTRHFELLTSCKNSLLKSIENIKNDLSPEFIASDLNTALRSLYSVVGKEYSDQVMDKVFKDFCIGK